MNGVAQMLCFGLDWSEQAAPQPFIWPESACHMLQKEIHTDSRLSSRQNETLCSVHRWAP